MKSQKMCKKIGETTGKLTTLLATVVGVSSFAVKACCMALLSVFAAAAWADVEYFVDAENGNDGYDGSSATFVSGSVGPMKTVGAAVARANADEVPSIVTLLPGRYDEGEYYEDGMTNRIVITEPYLKIRSTGGKEIRSSSATAIRPTPTASARRPCAAFSSRAI